MKDRTKENPVRSIRIDEQNWKKLNSLKKLTRRSWNRLFKYLLENSGDNR